MSLKGTGNLGNGTKIHIHRIPSEERRSPEGYRILVDADWPRSCGENGLGIDDWMPELGPTRWLSERFGRDPARWGTFRSRYRRQLRSQGRRRHLERIVRLARTQPVTLVTAAACAEMSPAAVIMEILAQDFGAPTATA
jgi:uncharacterized protein YeaO (DUF488 family)